MKRPGYLELGRRTAFGRRARKALGPVPPAPDPATAADFDLGTWRVRPALGRMTRADRIVVLDRTTLQALLILAEHRDDGVNRDELAARIWGGGDAEDHGPKLRRGLGFLRRAFSEDGAVRIANATGDYYVLEIGAPVEGRGLRGPDSGVLLDNPGGIEAWISRGRRRGLAIGLAGVIVVAIGVALILLVDRGDVVVAGHLGAMKTLAAEPGEKTSPGFSPDGRRVVYSWLQPDGTQKLYLRSITGERPHVLTGGSGRDQYPAWSPSGNLIAFQRLEADRCDVMVVTPEGRDPRRLGDCSFGAAGPMTWLRDGTALIYARRSASSMPLQLASLAVADGRLTGVTNPVVGMGGDSLPTLAHSGRRLAFLRTRSPGVADLTLLELGAGAPEKITRDGVAQSGAAWEPGGFAIVYASPRGGRSALWRSRLDGGAPQLLLGSGADLAAPAIAADGRTLVFEQWRADSRLARIAPAAGSAAATWRDVAARQRGARLSGDRARITFVSDEGGGDRLWVVPAAGGTPRALTPPGTDYLETPRWSADDRFVAYTVAHQGRLDLYAVELATGRVEALTRDGQSRAPSFSRDGRWLYFASLRTGGWQLWRRGWPEAGTAEQLTSEGGLAAVESRDGEDLYFVRPDRNGLWRRAREPGGDDTLVEADLAARDWRNFEVTAEAVWFVARPGGGPPLLARRSLTDGRTSYGAALTGLLDDSGITLDADGQSLIVAERTRTQCDIGLAALE